MTSPSKMSAAKRRLSELNSNLFSSQEVKKRSPYSITERRVPELIPVLGSQPAGDVSHKPDGRLPLLSARPAVTLATLKRAATNFAAWWKDARWVWTVCLKLLPDSRGVLRDIGNSHTSKISTDRRRMQGDNRLHGTVCLFSLINATIQSRINTLLDNVN